jgi:hypothetical protein
MIIRSRINENNQFLLNTGSAIFSTMIGIGYYKYQPAYTTSRKTFGAAGKIPTINP